MRDIALDLDGDGDVLIDAHGRMVLTEGTGAVRQRLYLRTSLWRGEYPPDTTVGLPYRETLGRKDGGRLLEQHLREAVTTSPGVAAVEAWDFALDRATRLATLGYTVRTTTGEVLDVPPYAVAEVPAP